MTTFKQIRPADIRTTTSNLNQLIDFADTDVSSSITSPTRKKYQVFVTGTSGDPGVTSSLYHTIFDQTHTLQSANELFDMTVGLYSGSSVVSYAAASPTEDSRGKFLFTSRSLMMREKLDIYRQHAQLLLGNAGSQFISPFTSTTATNTISEALFLNFKRLFVRDGIKRETFAMKFMSSASAAEFDEDGSLDATTGQVNLFKTTTSGSMIIVDAGSSLNKEMSQTGGEVGTLKNAANTDESLGLIFYQQGIVVLDLAKVTSGSQKISGSISAVGNAAGSVIMGSEVEGGNAEAKLIPDFLCSGSIDDILEHIGSTRFASGEATNKTFLTFQNNTKINSTLIFCRAEADEFNFSSNPTYTDSSGLIRVIEQTGIEKSFSFVTTVGLYDASRQLIAVAKLSRPVEKNDEKDLTFRVRLDF
jgi:hypothetical protein